VKPSRSRCARVRLACVHVIGDDARLLHEHVVGSRTLGAQELKCTDTGQLRKEVARCERKQASGGRERRLCRAPGREARPDPRGHGKKCGKGKARMSVWRQSGLRGRRPQPLLTAPGQRAPLATSASARGAAPSGRASSRDGGRGTPRSARGRAQCARRCGAGGSTAPYTRVADVARDPDGDAQAIDLGQEGSALREGVRYAAPLGQSAPSPPPATTMSRPPCPYASRCGAARRGRRSSESRSLSARLERATRRMRCPGNEWYRFAIRLHGHVRLACAWRAHHKGQAGVHATADGEGLRRHEWHRVVARAVARVRPLRGAE